MHVIKGPKSVFGRNSYDNDATNSILKVRVALYCPISEETGVPYSEGC
jgi:hypothetical protein